MSKESIKFTNPPSISFTPRKNIASGKGKLSRAPFITHPCPFAHLPWNNCTDRLKAHCNTAAGSWFSSHDLTGTAVVAALFVRGAVLGLHVFSNLKLLSTADKASLPLLGGTFRWRLAAINLHHCVTNLPPYRSSNPPKGELHDATTTAVCSLCRNEAVI